MENIVNKKEIQGFIQDRLRKNQPFCTLPWTKVWIEEGTKIRNCCYQTNSVGDLSVNTFQEIWNGKIQRDVREYILKGKLHPICKCIEKVGSIPVHPDPESIVHAADLIVTAASIANLQAESSEVEIHLQNEITEKKSYLTYQMAYFTYIFLKRIFKPYIIKHPKLHNLCLFAIKPLKDLISSSAVVSEGNPNKGNAIK